ncbi:MAG: carboxypeptidase regulatory-like domain-containing protein [Myxococcales bacterium]|nr:carboxypeptidase regulatory-like domain-containing protein [Myxococcales bacterium]
MGAPLAASASEGDYPPVDRPRVTIAPASTVGIAESSAVEMSGREAAPSISATPRLAASEVTTSDVGQNLEGGERTTPPIFRDGPAFSEVFVGRAVELDALRREYRMALDGRGRLVTVEGDAGVGKSRLLDAFGEWARSQGAGVLRGRFFAYEGDQPPPYETFLWMLTPPKPGEEPTRTTAGPPGSSPVAEPNLAHDKWRAFSRLTAGFADQAHGRPLLLAVDDLQWGTALDLEFLAYLPRAIDSTVMVVGTTRTGDRRRANSDLDAWLTRLGSQRALSTIRLEGFSIGEVRAWFQACFPGIRIRPQDLRRLQHATAGNPYYLTEVVGQLVQSRRIQQSPQGYSCAPLDRVALPKTVHSVVQAKLEGLGEELRKVLETACVIGEEFRFEVLQAALSYDEDALEAQLERAVKRNLLSEDCRLPTSDFRFDTTTLRSVLYDGLSRRRRRRLHRTVVDALLKLYGDDSDRIARLLSYHYHAVEDHEATLRWSLRAAADTLAHYDHDYAEICLRRAQDAAQTIATEGGTVPSYSAIDLDRLTGLLYVRIGRLEEADEALQRALDTAGQHADDEGTAVQRLDIILILAGCQLGRGLLEVSLDLSQMGIELAEELGERHLELEARLCTARAQMAMARLDDAALQLEAVIDQADGPELRTTRALAMAEHVTDVVVRVAAAHDLRGRVVAKGEPERGIEGASVQLAAGERGGPRATTDAEGRFVLLGVLAGPHVLVASASGWHQPGPGVGVTAADDTPEVVLELEPAPMIRGRVEPPAVAEVSIELRPENLGVGMGIGLTGGRAIVMSGGAKTESDADGRFALDAIQPGSTTVVARTADGRAGETTVQVGPEGADEVVVRLEPRATVRGEVRSLRGEPVAQATVALRRVQPAGAPVVRLTINGRDMGADMGTTTEDGRFELAGVAAGDYEVQVSDRYGEPLPVSGGVEGRGRLTVAKGADVDGLVLTVDAHDGVIEGVVRTSAGEPVPDVWVRATLVPALEGPTPGPDEGGPRERSEMRMVVDSGEGMGAQDRPPVLTDDQGRFQLTGLRDADYELTAEADGGRQRVSVVARPGADAVLRLADLGALEGQVTLDGRPLESFTVRVEGPSSHAVDVRDASGRYALGRLDPGRYRVTVSTAEGSGRAEVTVDEGQTARQDVVLEHLAKVTGRIVDAQGQPVAGAVLMLGEGADGRVSIESDGEQEHDTTDEDGRFEVRCASGSRALLALLPPKPQPLVVHFFVVEPGRDVDLGELRERDVEGPGEEPGEEPGAP